MTRQTVVPAADRGMYQNFHFSSAAWAGDTLHCSGQLGLDDKGKVPADLADEMRNVWQAIGRLLGEAGLGYADIIEYTSFHVGLQATLPAFMQARDAVLAEPWPAWTAIGISELAMPGAHVEVRITARKPA